jgi:hypothetical protein
MSEPITDAAREAAGKEALRNIFGEIPKGHHVQLAINAATEQLRSELESVKLELKTAHEQLFRAGDEPLAALGCAAENEATLRADLAAMTKERDGFEKLNRELSNKNYEAESYLMGCSKHGRWQGLSCIGCIESDLAVSQQTVERLREALGRYGEHEGYCTRHQRGNTGCVCGFTSALSSTTAPALVSSDTERLKKLRELCGYVEDGSDTKVTLLQDDATRTWFCGVGQHSYFSENGFIAAIDAAIEGELARTKGAE